MGALTQGDSLPMANSQLASADFGAPSFMPIPNNSTAQVTGMGYAGIPDAPAISGGLPQMQQTPAPKPDNASGQLPQAKLPFLQAMQQGGQNIANPQLTKLGKLTMLLLGAARGAAAGTGARTMAQGFALDQEGQRRNQEVQMQQQQFQQQQANLPFLRQYQQGQMDTQQAQLEHLKAETEALQDKPAPQRDVQKEYSDALARGDTATAQKLAPLVAQFEAATKPKAEKAKSEADQHLDAVAQSLGKGDASDLTPQERLKARKDYAMAGSTRISVGAQEDKGVLMSVPDGKGGMVLQRIRPGENIPQGSGTPTQKGAADAKASMDEQRRADLARNANENIDAFEEIAKRRPDLFGPVNGRVTEMKMAAGSSDPDVAALKAIHEYFGMASVGAHAMRNAQHVKDAANAVMDLHQSPQAILDPKRGSVARARNSLQTFLNDVEDKKPAGKQGAPAPKATANDPLGIR